MFLKKIEIQGFKSFADKTQIEFKSGITGVVGPNGSGKSNISDSIRWVLGEQSVKNLRGSKMEDVVFAGTENRKPLGFAEVTLVLDNSDKQLSIEYSEVSVTRRVFRSGESEYYINKNSCRLKDIRELFMDTGVGKDGYSIIGQGKIDEILSSKSEDRRNIFEEAAGIVKYKSRKEEAEKKLAKTEDNLLRINDIVEELEKQLIPLKDQSRKANEYKELSSGLKSLQINLYIREIENIKLELSAIDLGKDSKSIELERRKECKNNLDKKYTEMKLEIEKLEVDIEEMKNERYDTKINMENKKNEINLFKEKMSFFEKEIERYKSEILELNNYLVELKEQNDNIDKNKAILNEKLNKYKGNIDQQDNELKQLNEKIEKKEKYIEDKRSDTIEGFNLMAEKKSKINSLISFKQNIDKRLSQIGEELTDLNLLKENINTDKVNLDKNLNKDRKALNNTTEELKYIVKIKGDKKIDLENILRDINNIRADLQSKSSKHRVLKDMSREYEGYYKGVKNALKACERDTTLGSGVKGVLAELISTPKKYEKAMEIALGASIQNIVTESQEDAKEIINYLKKHNLGRVTFLPMSSIKERSLNLNEKSLLKDEGVIGVGSELLNYDPEYRGIIEYLLGRVIFVEKIEDGMAISKKCNYSLKIVSLDGDVLNPGGSMTGGSLNNSNTKLLGRQREIEELEALIDNLNLSYKKLDSEKDMFEKDIEELNLNALEKEKILNDIKLSIATLENRFMQNEEENNKNGVRIDKFLMEQRNLSDENKSILKDIESIELELKTLKAQNDETEKNIVDYIDDFEQEKTKKETLSKKITELRVESASFTQEYKSLIENLERVEEEKKKSLKNIENREYETERVSREKTTLSEKIKTCIAEQDVLTNLLKSYDFKLEKLNIDKVNSITFFKEEEEKLRVLNKDIYDLEKSIRELELKLEKSNIQYENYNNKLWEEYELSFNMALKYKEDTLDISKVEDDVRGIKSKIKSLGNINLNAIDEYKDVSERYEFMTTQIEDLTNAKDSLGDVIEDMDVKMKEQFLENFEIIKKNFIEVFEKLFGGGRADVYLENREDILSSGIEIVAQPPGKKLQSLSLLSGGERALTAISLLFAIIKTKPTPFCILDEIEAALDDANVYRYAEYLKEFSHSTQFIAITHRKGTMENVDSLYGVTMEEQGISKLVSIKLSEKEKVS